MSQISELAQRLRQTVIEPNQDPSDAEVVANSGLTLIALKSANQTDFEKNITAIRMHLGNDTIEDFEGRERLHQTALELLASLTEELGDRSKLYIRPPLDSMVKKHLQKKV